MLLSLMLTLGAGAPAQDVPTPSPVADPWQAAVEAAPAELRADVAFLVEHLPAADRAALEPARVIEEVRLAQVARAAVPWGADLPEALWQNDVLPFFHVSEARDPYRAELQQRYLERAAACKTPGEAALMLNRTLFGELGVRYSTARERADQSSKRTVETGLASCTGLSILLADACRAVGVPARLAGIASWVNKRGNHTWVEIWDGERWRFVGAAEPDPAGFDRTWFLGDVALAQAGSARHGVWAVSYAPTGHAFPMAWRQDASQVHGTEVTERYAKAQDGSVHSLAVKVLGPGDVRLAAPVVVQALEAEGQPALRLTGTSRDEGADTNDLLTFQVPQGRTWRVTAGAGDQQRAMQTQALDAQQSVITLRLGPDEEQLQRWVREDPAALREALWTSYRNSPEALALRADLDASVARTPDRTSPFTVKQVGERPAGGWPLVIAMHGGGGVPKEFNDSQWEHMQVYYKDHPEVTGYRYLALRAPNDTWNGFYDDAIAPLIRRLVRAQVLLEGVDANAVHAIGYSHGGYGAFVIGPKLPDLFASVHASAAAPTGGETRAANLANLNFSCMVGENDTAYGRVEKCRAFGEEQARLAEAYPGLYHTTTEVILGKGHGGLPDRDLLTRQLLLRREPLPRHVIWETSGADVAEQYWVSVDEPADGQRIEARLEGQRVEVTTAKVRALSLWLDERLVDLGQPLTVVLNGQEQSVTLNPSVAVARQALARWGDPERLFLARVDLQVSP